MLKIFSILLLSFIVVTTVTFEDTLRNLFDITLTLPGHTFLIFYDNPLRPNL